MADGGVAVEAMVESVVRIEEPVIARLVHELLGKIVATAREARNIAGTALRPVPVEEVVDAVAVIRAFDLQGGGVVSEP